MSSRMQLTKLTRTLRLNLQSWRNSTIRRSSDSSKESVNWRINPRRDRLKLKLTSRASSLTSKSRKRSCKKTSRWRSRISMTSCSVSVTRVITKSHFSSSSLKPARNNCSRKLRHLTGCKKPIKQSSIINSRSTIKSASNWTKRSKVKA